MTDIADDLRERRRVVHARWRTLRDEMKAAEADLKAIERVLALVSPSMAAAADVRGRRPRAASAGAGGIFNHGELAAAAKAALDTLGRPSTSAGVAEQMLREKGLEPDDPRLPGLINRVSAAMSDWATKGKIARSGAAEGGRGGLWEVMMSDADPRRSGG